MVEIVGGPNYKGQTAEVIDPLSAEMVALLRRQERRAARKDDPKAADKIEARKVNYTLDAEYPFQCGTCVSWNGATALCDKVEGPYEKGRVRPADSCSLWYPARKTLGPKNKRKGR